jgi:hypothetical protein
LPANRDRKFARRSRERGDLQGNRTDDLLHREQKLRAHNRPDSAGLDVREPSPNKAITKRRRAERPRSLSSVALASPPRGPQTPPTRRISSTAVERLRPRPPKCQLAWGSSLSGRRSPCGAEPRAVVEQGRQLVRQLAASEHAVENAHGGPGTHGAREELTWPPSPTKTNRRSS